MTAKNKAKVNPKLLRWARESAGFDISTAAKKINRPVDDLREWESGKSNPTIAQARKAAHVYRRPFATLFLNKIPAAPPQLLDYRKISDDTPDKLSPELRLLIRKVRNKQEWAREWRLRSGFEPLSFIGSWSISKDLEQLAGNIRELMGMPLFPPKGFTKDGAFNFWYDAAELVGIYVIRSNEIDPAEARGFTIADPYAPFIFVNNNDSKSAKIFTLIHEIVHLWLGHTSLSNPLAVGRYKPGAARIEKYCNRAAASVLMPTEAVDQVVNKWLEHNSIRNIRELVGRIEYVFKVSEESAARKLMDSGLLSQEVYNQIRNESVAAWAAKRIRDAEKRKGKPAPIKPSIKAANRNGHSLIEAVIEAVDNDFADEVTAAKILETRVPHLDSMHEVLIQAHKRRSQR